MDKLYAALAGGTTLSSILADIGTVLTTIFGVFSDMIEAVTSNTWLLISILFGFGGTIVAMAFKIIKKARRI